MSQKRKNTDYLDDLFDKHFNDKDFMNTNLADFGQMVRDTINEEARKQGYDTMSDLISGEIQEVSAAAAGPANVRSAPPCIAVTAVTARAMSMCGRCWKTSCILRVSAAITAMGIRMHFSAICAAWRSTRMI